MSRNGFNAFHLGDNSETLEMRVKFYYLKVIGLGIKFTNGRLVMVNLD